METGERTAPREAGEGSVEVRPVEGRRMLGQFIRQPWALYADDPAWVPPLLIERRQFFSPKNPYFDHAEFQAWIAFRGGRPVGRISAQIDRLHIERYHDATGFFGMLEAEDRAETFQALIATAEGWLHHRGMRRVLGPFNLSINQELGLLVEGFEHPPVLMMGHARPYYGSHIEAQGYVKAKDLLAYMVPMDFKYTPTMQAVLRRAAGKVTVRYFRRAHMQADLRILREIFEDAWSNNWCFVPFTEAEFEHLGRDLKQLVPMEWVAIAEVGGAPAAMIVGFPDINATIRDLNGRLLPFGWIKLLWRLKIGFPKTARVPLMGVCKRYHDSWMGAALALMVIDAVRVHGTRRGVERIELSWILEDNLPMRKIIEAIGGDPYKRYRVYEKEIGAT
jgi:hypothetical protein